MSSNSGAESSTFCRGKGVLLGSDARQAQKATDDFFARVTDIESSDIIRRYLRISRSAPPLIDLSTNHLIPSIEARCGLLGYAPLTCPSIWFSGVKGLVGLCEEERQPVTACERCHR
jgi:hypothetical protein